MGSTRVEPFGDRPQPGQPIVRAFHTGLAELSPVDVIVELDAVSFDTDYYFERRLAAFSADPVLGIANGQCYELRGGEWLPRRCLRALGGPWARRLLPPSTVSGISSFGPASRR